MTRARLHHRAPAALACLGLLALAGCGAGDSDAAASGDNGIATLQTDDSGTETEGAATDDADRPSADEAALEFSQCLRDEGLDVADIGVDADGNIDIRSALDSVDPGDESFRTAMQSCSEILGDVGFGGGRAGTFDETELQDAYLEFSECIRTEGFEDVPDLSFQAPGGGRPGAGDGAPTPPADGSAPERGEGQRAGNFGDRTSRLAEGLDLDPDDPAVIAALDACSPIIDNAFGGPGAAATEAEG
jgi:hypothetical protein